MSYYNLKNPHALGGIKNFSKEYLKGQPAYTLHKPIVRKFKRNKFYSKGIDDFWQADLADMSQLSTYNDGYKYLLVVIDVFSKYLWVFPLKDKRPLGVLDALKSLKKKPNLLMTDKGTEFQNHSLKKYFNDIKYYTSNSPDTKASIAERVIRTIKSRIYRYFTYKGSYRYIDVLQDIVKGYNSRVHRSIGMAPKDVTKADENKIRMKLYKKPKSDKPVFKPGDKVRIAKQKLPFHKGYLPQWSEEIFTIDNVLTRDPIVYKLTDYYGEAISGIFYKQELQKVDEIYRVEKVIEKKKGKALVKWMGYKEPTWETLHGINMIAR